MKTALLEGQVLRPDGRPEEGAVVAVDWGTSPYPDAAVITRWDGRFTLSLPGGDYHLVARTRSGLIGEATVGHLVAGRKTKINVPLIWTDNGSK